ncbi:helix-turn-helix domain-containing protein [Acidocella facilis]|uniref:helix-turn-helix domain-containing protein n=1 Tax=Acidocella facilis TaxID=525 RepID=UPI001F2C0281|nr:helix-turn-helix domain-containing protein [Acidocella facilis]
MDGCDFDLYSINDASAKFALSRAEIYRRLRSGDLQARKNGKRTLIDGASLRRFVDSMPAATFRPLPNQAA